MTGSQPFPLVQYIPAFPGSTSAGNSGQFETLMSETRTQNSEIRMHLCRLTDKLDTALQKVGKISRYVTGIAF